MLPMLASFWTQAILLPGLSEALGLQAQATTWHPNALDPGNHLFQVPVPPRAWAREDLRTLQSWEESGGGARGVFGVEELTISLFQTAEGAQWSSRPPRCLAQCSVQVRSHRR